jgi:hypothetical protein
VGLHVLFQGSDPATDLRGVGFLGLVQVLYLVMTPELLPFARDVYALSRKEDQVNSKYEFCTRSSQCCHTDGQRRVYHFCEFWKSIPGS